MQVTTTTSSMVTRKGGINMDKIEDLAFELAVLPTQDLMKLAQILVDNYPTRADMFETQLNAAFFYNNTEIEHG